MANSVNTITRTTSLSDYLADPVSDGTRADIIQVEKTDAAGQEAAATDIAENGGCLVANTWDDATIRVIQMYYGGTKLWKVADDTARDALGSDDDLAVDDLAYVVATTLLYYCVSVDGGAASTWSAIAATGSVAGPGLSTDNAVMRWDGAGGATAQNSVVIISDLGAISGVTDITLSGTIDGRNVSADGATLDAHVASIANPHSTNLQQALVSANTTAGTNIEVSNGDEIVGEDGGHVRFAAGTGLVEMTDAEVDGDLSVTGKLTVAGLIDPSGLVLDEQAASPFNAAGKHTIWAKDTVPTTLWTTDDAGNDYQVSTSSTQDLAAVLTLGNTTDGTNIILSSSSQIVGESGGGGVYIAAGQGSETGAGGLAEFYAGAGGNTSGDGGAMYLGAGPGIAGDSAGGLVDIAAGQPSGTGTAGAVSIRAAAASGGNVVGGAVTIDAGDGFGTQAGGAITCTAGDGGLTGAGGAAAISGGAGGGTSGAGGGAYVVGGAASAGNSAGGEAGCLGGAGSGNATGGQARVQAGAGGGTGTGGTARLQAGAGGATSGTGGVAEVIGGAGSAATATGGAATMTAGAGGSGAATGGAITITSGAGGGTSGNSGAVTIASGAVTSGTRGTITLNASDIIVTNQGYHSVRGATARGSVNTLIYRWTSVVDNVGTDITYTDSGTAGGSWAINNAGVYTVSCSVVAGHNGYVAIKKAAAVSNTFDATDIMVAHTVATNNVSMSWTGYCSAGDDIWIATDTATNPTTPTNNNRVTVARVR